MHLLGYDIGSSSVKASLIEVATGICKASAYYPQEEMRIEAAHVGWAEQDPELWWMNLKLATQKVLSQSQIDPKDIKAIGISYQMHGLVMVDRQLKSIRPSIIWCDSRAVSIGEKALENLGTGFCMEHFLNSPGNFTASKLKWVQENEPELYARIYKVMLPGDYIAMRLSGEINTTVSGLSEGVLWDFKYKGLANSLLEYYRIENRLLADIVPTFGTQSFVSKSAATELGLAAGTVISYRAGDQPNNAFSLNVLHPGEIAATAGTSGVVYGVSDMLNCDMQSRVNTFAHVNYSTLNPRLGVLLCINGTGILNAWLKRNFLATDGRYEKMNSLAGKIPVGSDGLIVLPFGNGAERILNNKNIGAHILNMQFNRHKLEHVLRASQEGIVFSFKYGMEIMKTMGISPKVIRAGNANMFLSPVFRETLANVTGSVIELFDTDGSQGAAKGSGIGAGIYSSEREAFQSLKKIKEVVPDDSKAEEFLAVYSCWKTELEKLL